MGYSKAWLNLTDDERREKRREYNNRYKSKHPERAKEQRKRYDKKHYTQIRKRASDWQRKKGVINKLKAIEYLGGKCADCGGVFENCCYDFHHLDPSKKEFSFTQIAGRTFEKIIPELDKCILLCSHCHRIRHFYENWSVEEIAELKSMLK